MHYALGIGTDPVEAAETKQKIMHYALGIGTDPVEAADIFIIDEC